MKLRSECISSKKVNDKLATIPRLFNVQFCTENGLLFNNHTAHNNRSNMRAIFVSADYSQLIKYDSCKFDPCH